MSTYTDTQAGNLTESWAFRLYHGAEGGSDFLGLTTGFGSGFGGGNYYNIVTNNPNIRKSIDLSKCTSKTSNISLSTTNIEYKGKPLSQELLYSSRKYINRKVIVVAYNGINTYETIYTGRLVDISFTPEIINLSITDKRPTDFISIPNTKEPIADKWIPVAYGDFAKTTSSDLYTGKFLYPAPEVTTSGSLDKYFVVGGSATNVNPHYYDNACDKFFPILDGAGGSEICNSPIVQQSVNYVKIDRACHKDIIVKPSIGTETVPVGIGNPFPTPDEAYKIGDNPSTFPDVSTYFAHQADYTAPTTFFAGERGTLRISSPHDHDPASSMEVSVKNEFYLYVVDTSSYSTNTNLRLIYGDATTSPSGDICNTNTGGQLGSSNTRSTTISASDWKSINQHALVWYANAFTLSGSNDFQWRTKIFDVKITGTTGLDTSNHQANANAMKEIKQVYIGGNGLDQSWNTGYSATKVHEVHRDLLYRFTGYTDTPQNWSSGLDISTEKHQWKVKWWALEPIELEKVLDKLQEEGCFIFLWDKSGDGKYIFVKDSYNNTTDIDLDLTVNDVSNVKVRKSNFSDLLTKMDVNYEKHPAKNEHKKKTTFENSSARTNLKIGAKENIANKKLDMLHDTTIGSDSDVTGYWNYHNKIFGDIKTIITCDIVNPDKWNVDLGDIVRFSDEHDAVYGFPEMLFYDIYVVKFMVVGISRKVGGMSVELREVQFG